MVWPGRPPPRKFPFLNVKERAGIRFRKLAACRKSLVRREFERVSAKPGLKRGVFEIVDGTLKAG